jgi:lipid II:glycine glycyltransferase (peptidoglycan interpeptide bridge formation enzyme)
MSPDMQLPSASKPAPADPRPTGPTASSGQPAAGSTAAPAASSSTPGQVGTADRARTRQLLEELTIVVTSAPEPELRTAWDELVARTANTDVAQLSAWATLRAEAGYEPLYLLATSGPWLLGGGLVLRRTVRGAGRVGYMSYGPVLSQDLVITRPVVRHRLVEALAALARQHAALFVQPPDGGDDIALELLQHGFRFSTAGVAPAATVRVDLTQTEDELRANLNRRLRTWTRQWPQRGVKVRVGDERDIPLLTKLAAETARFQEFSPFPEHYLETTYHELAQGGNVLLLIAELAGVPVAAELFSGVGGVLKSRITGMDRTSESARDVMKLNVASAMIWEAISWGKANGYRAFDFGGLRPASVEALRRPGPIDQDAVAAPDVFKTKFGGEVWVYPPAVEMIHSRVLRTGYDVLRKGEGGQKFISFVKETLRGTR